MMYVTAGAVLVGVAAIAVVVRLRSGRSPAGAALADDGSATMHSGILSEDD
jgi:hypothetical protein